MGGARIVEVMRLGVAAWVLVGLGSIACVASGELTTGEGEVEPPVAAEAVAPAAPTHAVERRAADPPPSRPAANAAPEHDEAERPFDARFADQVRAVVGAYEAWGRVDDEARWAPWLCRMPRAAAAHVSESDDPHTHGHKLYTLYAMDPVAYGAQPSAGMLGSDAPGSGVLPGLSQVIVKESFSPISIDDVLDTKLGGSGPDGGMGPHRLRPAERDGGRFVAGERRGLYVMMKPEAPTEGTDAGWIYATVEPDMITVTAVGVIESCAGCHAEAGDGRLFGLPGLQAPKAPGSRNRANAAPR